MLQLGLNAVAPSGRPASLSRKRLLKELQKVNAVRDAVTADNATLQAHLQKEKSSKTELQEDLHALYVQLLDVINGKQVCAVCHQAFNTATTLCRGHYGVFHLHAEQLWQYSCSDQRYVCVCPQA